MSANSPSSKGTMREIRLDNNYDESNDKGNSSESENSPLHVEDHPSDAESGKDDDRDNNQKSPSQGVIGDKRSSNAGRKHSIKSEPKVTPKALVRYKNHVKSTKSNPSKSNEKNTGNILTPLIPGYTAPMRLEAPSLRGKTNLTISQLRKQSLQKDASLVKSSIAIFNKDAPSFDPASAAKKVKTPSSIAIQKSIRGSIPKIPTSFSSSFRTKPSKCRDDTAGSGWFGMTPPPLTDQLKTDLAMIRNRNYLDPKKFYKSADSFEGKVLQVGTVIEGNTEFYSSRLTRRERRGNLTEELMANGDIAAYAKRKYGELQREKEERKGKNRGNGGKRGRKGR
ncbi:hypothetical protein ACHAXS_004605 [Conticribra weissflogii]